MRDANGFHVGQLVRTWVGGYRRLVAIERLPESDGKNYAVRRIGKPRGLQKKYPLLLRPARYLGTCEDDGADQGTIGICCDWLEEHGFGQAAAALKKGMTISHEP